MASGDQVIVPQDMDNMSEEGASKEPQLTSVEPQDLPGYLPWEQDLEMVSKFLDRKVSMDSSTTTVLLMIKVFIPSII